MGAVLLRLPRLRVQRRLRCCGHGAPPPPPSSLPPSPSSILFIDMTSSINVATSSTNAAIRELCRVLFICFCSLGAPALCLATKRLQHAHSGGAAMELAAEMEVCAALGLSRDS